MKTKVDEVSTEVSAFQKSLASLTKDEVLAVYGAQVSMYGDTVDARKATRVELSAALQLKNAAPHSLTETEAAGVLTCEERDEKHERCRQQVSVRHRAMAERARGRDPFIHDAHHFVQKLHGEAIWREVDRLMALAGIPKE